MSNPSLKDQLKAMVSKLPEKSKQTNRQPKPKWLDHAQYGVELLRAYFPETFKEQGETRPLKVGIKQDLVKFLSTSDKIVTDDKACMVKSLTYYVNTVAYLKCVLAGVPRVDLEGHPAGIVTAEEAKYSLEKQESKRVAKQTAQSRQKESTRKENTITS